MRFTRIFFCSFVLVGLLMPALLQGQSLKKQIDSLWQVYAQRGFSGVLLVADKGRPVYRAATGYRVYAAQTALQSADIFELASVSKQFTAMIILMLQEKGRLRVDDPVDQYLDIPYKNRTIRQLLNHTGGLPDYQAIMDKYWDKSRVAGNEDCIEYLNRYAPTAPFAPGEKYEYSNTGYLLLASIAEKVSGKDFISLCREWIFRPLRMNKTDIRSAEQKKARTDFAAGHIFVKEKDRYVRADSFPASDYTIWLGNRRGPGRISSTANDLLKWDRALYRRKLVRRATLEEAFQPAVLNNGQKSQYGFGWDLRAHPVLGPVVEHNGDNPGYRTMITRYTQRKQTVILLCNNAHSGFRSLLKELENILAAEAAR